jgi:peptide/nickel transport system substrate-binding protein
MNAALIRRLAFAGAMFALAGAPVAAEPRHGVAMHGEPALPADFAHLPYAEPNAKKGGRLTLGFPGTFDSLNPFNLKAGSAAHGLYGNIFQSLMARNFDEPFTLYGLIAQTIETDEARERITFRLNPKARFSDGQSITSADVVFSFNLLKTKGRPQHRAAYALVKSIEAPDALTIRYDASGAQDRELPLTLALMPVLPKHRIDPERFTETSLDIPIGSGPYRITQMRPGERLMLTRNPDYWGRDLPIHRGLYNFDEIQIEYFRDANSLFEAFKAGLVDYRDETSPTRWTGGYEFPAIRDGAVKKEALPIGMPKGMEGFAFNLRRPLFQDAQLREALAAMFDFEWINANYFSGLYTRTQSFFDDSELSSIGKPASERERALLAPFPGVVREDILEGRWRVPATDGSGRDRAQARRALALAKDAGYALKDGVLAKNGAPLEFEIMVRDRAQERLALAYADQLRRIGVVARVRLVDEVQYQRRRQKFDFDMMIGAWIASASPGNEQRARWGSQSANQESAFNLAGVASPAVDALIAAMVAATTKDDFIAAVRAFDRVLLSGFYITPLYHSPTQWIAASTKLARPDKLPRYALPLFGVTLDAWWRQAP